MTGTVTQSPAAVASCVFILNRVIRHKEHGYRSWDAAISHETQRLAMGRSDQSWDAAHSHGTQRPVMGRTVPVMGCSEQSLAARFRTWDAATSHGTQRPVMGHTTCDTRSTQTSGVWQRGSRTDRAFGPHAPQAHRTRHVANEQAESASHSAASAPSVVEASPQRHDFTASRSWRRSSFSSV